MATPLSANQQMVSSFYLSYYGRPADTGGLAYWTNQLNLNGGNLDTIVKAFASSAESTANFGGMTTAQHIAHLYQELLGRAPEPLGAAYWLGEVTAGRMTIAQLAINVSAGAQNTDATTVQVRQQLADQFTASLPADGTGYSGQGAIEAARLIIQAANASTSAADVASLAAVGVTLATSATANPSVITALTGATGHLTDLLGTTAGAANPLALVNLVNTIVTAAAGNAASLTTLLGTGTLTDVITTLPAGTTLTGLDTAITGGGLAGGGVVVNPPVTPPGGGGDTGSGDSGPVVPPADATAPVLDTATVNGNTLVLTYTEANLLEATNKPAPGAFEVLVGGVANDVTTVVVDASAKTVTLTLTNAVLSTDAVTVGYTAPTPDAANTNAAIQDATGNDAASLTASEVTVVNNTPVAAPTFTVTDSGDGHFTVGASNSNVTVTSDGTNYTFTPDNGTAVTKTIASVNSLIVNTITLTGDAAVLNGETITGTGTVAITALESTLDADLSKITATTVTAAINAGNVQCTFTGNLGNAKLLVTGSNTYSVDLVNGSPTIGTNATFDVSATTTIFANANDLTGKAVTGLGNLHLLTTSATAGEVNTQNVDAGVYLSISISESVDISNNSNLVGVDSFSVFTGRTLTMKAIQADGKDISGEGAVTITGSDDAQTISVATTGANSITGGKGADQVTLGAGADTVVVGFGTAGTSESTATFDVANDAAADTATRFSIVIDGNITVTNENVEAATTLATLAAAMQAVLRVSDKNNQNITVTVVGGNSIVVTDALGREITGASLKGEGMATEIDSSIAIDNANSISIASSDSTLAAPDIITGFAIGTDKVDLLTVSNGVVDAPTTLNRVADVATSDDLAGALSAAFADLTANQAGLVVISAGTAAGTYLYADNGNGAVDITADVFIKLVGATGTLGVVGDLTVTDYFA